MRVHTMNNIYLKNLTNVLSNNNLIFSMSTEIIDTFYTYGR